MYARIKPRGRSRIANGAGATKFYKPFAKWWMKTEETYRSHSKNFPVASRCQSTTTSSSVRWTVRPLSACFEALQLVPDVWFFLVAMELMFTNCKRFNDPAALLYRDADVLRNVYLEAVKERFPGHPVPPSITVSTT